MIQGGDPIAAPHVPTRHLYAGHPLMGWTHRRRYRRALALARPFAGGRVLDYGCGDGSFLAQLDDSDTAPALAIGAEIDPRLVVNDTVRLAARSRVRFVDVTSLQSDSEAASYDAIFCMEVLEHVPEAEPLLSEFARLLRPAGTLLISVPIETGLPVVVKQIARRVACWQRVGHYPGTSPYRFHDMAKSVVATSRTHLVRPVFVSADGRAFHDHKGFNWRALRAVVASKFDILRIVFSPFNWPGSQFGTQVWFVARPR